MGYIKMNFPGIFIVTAAALLVTCVEAGLSQGSDMQISVFEKCHISQT